MAKEKWRIWNDDKEYGDLFYQRATGGKPEMESSKAAAQHVKKLLKENDTIVDIGCGAGHYLLSLEKTLDKPFKYIGIDQTPYYMEMAKKAQSEKKHKTSCISAEFKVGDIFNLDLPDNCGDIVMCNNVLLHLPSVAVPLKELWRVTKRCLVVRTLIGETAFRIKQVLPEEDYDQDGEPLNAHYFNIYSKGYFTKVISKLEGVKDYNFEMDTNWNPKNLGSVNYDKNNNPLDLTTVVNGMQVNNYIIEPWQFLTLLKGR